MCVVVTCASLVARAVLHMSLLCSLTFSLSLFLSLTLFYGRSQPNSSTFALLHTNGPFAADVAAKLLPLANNTVEVSLYVTTINSHAQEVESSLRSIIASGVQTIILAVEPSFVPEIVRTAARLNMTGDGWLWICSEEVTYTVLANDTDSKEAMQGESRASLLLVKWRSTTLSSSDSMSNSLSVIVRILTSSLAVIVKASSRSRPVAPMRTTSAGTSFAPFGT